MKTKNLLKKAFLLLALMGGANSVWADDVVSATQTFTNARVTCTWTGMNVSVAKNSTCGGDGLYFVAGSGGTITTSSSVVNIKSGRIMYVEVPSATSKGTISIIGSASPSPDRNVELNSGETITMSTSGGSAPFVSTDVENVNGGYYIKVSSISDFKFNQVSVTLTDETYPESSAIAPTFSLTSTTVSTSGNTQIQVGSKGNLDGITLSSITYTKSGVVAVDEDGVVTPVATGTTTINFNSVAVAGKYNASEGNSLTVTVIEPVTVFDASATNAEFVLSQANITNAYNEFVSTASEDWADRTMPAPYSSTSYYNLSGKSRFITFKASGASTFQIFIQNGSSSNRKYTVKVGEGDGVDVTAATNSLTSSPVFATGTKGEVTIKIIGTSDGSLYPAAIKFNPAVSKTITSAGWATYCSPYALDFSSSIANLTKAYIVTGATGSTLSLADITGTIPANTGILLEGEGEVVIPVVASSSTSVSGNKLVGVTSNTSIEANAGYVLMNETAGVGFYKNANAFTVGANTAYLPVNFAGAARSAYFFGGVTGVDNVEAAAEAKAQDGKFIENGKLVIVKNGQKYNAAGAKLY